MTTESFALFRLQAMVAWNHEPELTEGEVQALYDECRRPDVNGVAPGLTGWEPTFNLYSAAAEGWRWKAGKSAKFFRVEGASRSFSKHQVYDHCMKMADLYEKKAASSNPLSVRMPGNLVVDRGSAIFLESVVN